MIPASLNGQHRYATSGFFFDLEMIPSISCELKFGCIVCMCRFSLENSFSQTGQGFFAYVAIIV